VISIMWTMLTPQTISSPTKGSNGPFSLTQSFVNWLCMDVPLLCVLLTYASLQWFDYVQQNYIVPQTQAFHWTAQRAETEHTYYTRPCDASDLSTNRTLDMFLSPLSSDVSVDAANIQLKHGFTFVEDVLSPQTMSELRDHIHWKNHNDKNLFVISKKHRFNILLGTEERSVRNALQEIANHAQFKQSLEAILGPNPAMVEMTAISSSPGAEDQYWHQDGTFVPHSHYRQLSITHITACFSFVGFVQSMEKPLPPISCSPLGLYSVSLSNCKTPPN
jgi:Phytanoyl-CoA dioxygenase (PhyH)